MSEESTNRQTVIIQQQKGEPGCIIQALWFLFVGWWVGGLAVSLAWFLNALIITLPFGMAILNNLPKILALQDPETRLQVIEGDDFTQIVATEQEQHPFWLRALYFLVIGWWWSGIWMSVAYVLCVTILLMPIGLRMFRMTPAMTTLRRY